MSLTVDEQLTFAFLYTAALSCFVSAFLFFFRQQYFDLHDMFVRWVNLPQCKDKQLDYSQFLQALGKFEEISEQEKVRGDTKVMDNIDADEKKKTDALSHFCNHDPTAAG